MPKENINLVYLWNVFAESKLIEIELDEKKSKASFAKWSKTHPVLAIGSDKGALTFFNKKNSKRIPTMGKHTKKIISGDWNKDGQLSNISKQL